jgi:hypothetical protein
MFLQLVSAPVYNATVVRPYLDKLFPKRLWHYSLTNTVPRFNAVRRFLWKHLKTVAYADPPVSLQDKIQAACDVFSEDQIKTTTVTAFLIMLEPCTYRT